MDLQIYIGGKIKQFRNDNNMNQQELAEELETTKQSISRYESGQRKIDQDTLFKLTDIFNVGIDEFFPPIKQDTPVLEEIKSLNDSEGADIEVMAFFQKLMEKTLSMDTKERERFLESIRFTIDYYQKMNKDN